MDYGCEAEEASVTTERKCLQSIFHCRLRKRGIPDYPERVRVSIFTCKLHASSLAIVCRATLLRLRHEG